MQQFLSLLIQWLSINKVAPPEVQSSDQGSARSKSYIFDLPDGNRTPDFVFAFRIYNTRHNALIEKQVAEQHVQCLVRSNKQREALIAIDNLYLFLLKASGKSKEPIKLDNDHWALIDCSTGPIKVEIDEKGRHIWSLNFKVITNVY